MIQIVAVLPPSSGSTVVVDITAQHTSSVCVEMMGTTLGMTSCLTDITANLGARHGVCNLSTTRLTHSFITQTSVITLVHRELWCLCTWVCTRFALHQIFKGRRHESDLVITWLLVICISSSEWGTLSPPHLGIDLITHWFQINFAITKPLSPPSQMVELYDGLYLADDYGSDF